MPSEITVVGAGYVGLTTAACFAHLGHQVTCTDIDAKRVASLKSGEVPILEAGLDNMLREGLTGGRLSFAVGSASAAAESEFVYLCVPTPQGSDGSADLSYIEAAAAEIGPVLAPEAIVINKSTVPVGSTLVVERALGRSDVFVVSNPEFLREGSAVHDFLHPDRIVIGAEDQAAAVRVAALYIGIAAPLIVTDPPSAELIKYASNAFLAAKVSFVNAIAAVCEAVGADMNDVVLGMGYDKRIGHEFLKPGPGWGGSCFLGAESVLVRRSGRIRLLSFEELWREVDELGIEGLEALSWRGEDVTPEFRRVSAATCRPYDGHVIEVRTKMGRRITTTADHDFVARTGSEGGRVVRKLASELTTSDWLPVAQGFPLVLEHDLRVGRDCYTHRIPDQIWGAPESDKRALLRRLWDGDGSWSHVRGGPSVVLEYGTVSRALADGMVRLLGDLGIVARLEVARTTKSTVDTYWLMISGAEQVERALFLLPEAEARAVVASMSGQRKRIKPTGYRRLGEKNAAWVRVTTTARRRHQGLVYSIEVPGAHTIVSSYGTVVGNCFPKDSRALIRIAEDAGYDFDLMQGVVTVNQEQLDRMAEKASAMVGGSVDGVTFAVWGLTFKARTDDLRESPSVAIIHRLLASGAHIKAYDPSIVPPVLDRRSELLEGIELAPDPYAACDGAEALLVLTEWDEFRWLDFDRVAAALASPVVLDGRNLLDREALRRRGFTYQGVGRV